MRKAFALGSMLVFFACPASADGGICDPGRAAVGAVIGVVVGTLIFPGIGTALGASLGGGSLCASEFAWSRFGPARADAENDVPVQTIAEAQTISENTPAATGE